MNKKTNYKYSLSPFYQPLISDNEIEIDLNQSSDFSILFTSNNINETQDENLQDYQIKRLDFLKTHTKELNIIANTTRQLISISDINFKDIELITLYYDIVSGKYGKEPIDFFKTEDNENYAEIILYYLIKKNRNNRREYYFESVLMRIFDNKVNFYYDKVKNKLYILFVAKDSKLSRDIFEICKFFFADILLDIEVRWRVYPAIIDKSNYIIASEGEQLCGTII